MSEEFSRTRRVGEQLKRELAPLVQEIARDTSLGMITITAADVSPDLKQAKVYVTAIGSALETKEIISILNASAGSMRQHLSHIIRLRSVPKLRFLFDESVERGARVSALIDSVAGEESSNAPADELKKNR